MSTESAFEDFDSTNTPLSVKAMPDGEMTVKMVVGKTKYDKFKGSANSPAGPIMVATYEVVTPPAPKGETGDDKYVGKEFVYKHWLNRPQSREQTLKELERLGFAVSSWGDQGSDFPRSRMVPLAYKYLRLNGVVLRVSKKSNTNEKNPDEPFVNLYMNGKTEGGSIPNADVLAIADKPETAEDLF